MATVATGHLEPGTFVHTVEAGGKTDFGMPLVKPTTGRVRSTVREVRSSVSGVVRFTDGTKSSKLHGRTVWLLATEEEAMLS